MPRKKEFSTEVSKAYPDKIMLRGLDLCDDIMGKIPFGDAVFITLTGRKPTRQESVLTNAILASGIDHGITPSAMVARLINNGAPEAFQAAVSGGLLSLGDQFGGVIERSARMLQEGVSLIHSEKRPAREIAISVVADYSSKQTRIPGLGHPLHRSEDPRTRRLFEIARKVRLLGEHTALMELIAREASAKKERELSINVDGAIGALISDMGFHWSVGKSFFLIGRTAGLSAHVMEERENHMVWTSIEHSGYVEKPAREGSKGTVKPARGTSRKKKPAGR